MKKLGENVKAVALGTIMCLFTIVPVFAQENGNLSDAEIASVAVVANQNDIDFAEIAKKRSKNPEVLNFAETMATDHKAIIALAVELVTDLGVTPKDNPVSQQLKADAEKTKQMLTSIPVTEFDKAYIDNEVAYHTAVTGAVEGVLIPQSENMELEQLLQQALTILKTHQKHAQMVQKEFAE